MSSDSAASGGAGAGSSSSHQAEGGTLGRSADVEALEQLERELAQRIFDIEKRLYKEETHYFETTPAPGMVAGWEIVIEGRTVDRKKYIERVFSDSSETWRRHRREVEARREERMVQEALAAGYTPGSKQALQHSKALKVQKKLKAQMAGGRPGMGGGGVGGGDDFAL